MTNIVSVAVFPEMAREALKSNQESGLAAYSLLKESNSRVTQGSGLIPRRDAVAELCSLASLGPRQAQRILKAGHETFWDLTEPWVCLYSFGKAASRLGIDHVTRPRKVRVADLTGGRALRKATLVATAVPLNPMRRPTTRRFLRDATGVPATTQRRLERRFGRVQSVTPLYLPLRVGGSNWYASQVAQFFRDVGFFAGTSPGGVVRRLGDIRAAVDQDSGSTGARQRANRALKAQGRPALRARGQRPPRVYFQAPQPNLRWLRQRRARGHSPDGRVHPILDYSVALRVTRRGSWRASKLSMISSRDTTGRGKSAYARGLSRRRKGTVDRPKPGPRPGLRTQIPSRRIPGRKEAGQGQEPERKE